MKTISSPPRAARPPQAVPSDAARRKLLELARAIALQPTRKGLLEYLALRRFVRPSPPRSRTRSAPLP